MYKNHISCLLCQFLVTFSYVYIKYRLEVSFYFVIQVFCFHEERERDTETLVLLLPPSASLEKNHLCPVLVPKTTHIWGRAISPSQSHRRLSLIHKQASKRHHHRERDPGEQCEERAVGHSLSVSKDDVAEGAGSGQGAVSPFCSVAESGGAPKLVVPRRTEERA